MKIECQKKLKDTHLATGLGLAKAIANRQPRQKGQWVCVST